MDLPQAERLDWVGALHGPDEVLRPWLNRVLGSAAGLSTEDFLSPPAWQGEPLDAFAAGDQIGPYRLESLLGEGGMGRVWRASCGVDGPAREVALKLPHAELLAGPFRARFKRERDVLAGLTHPQIAALYDAGVSADNHPYLALELICGSTITDHCRDCVTPLESRIGLMGQVLAALSYAHGRLIVHRDIKPSNVLVTPQGQVKLLDFGIAKLLDPARPEGGPALTQPAARLATPGYAPPEQMVGGAITVATDIFSAGVLAFELCTGQCPPPLSAGGPDAPLASTRANAQAANLPEGAGLRRKLRGDLDAIIARALSIDPAQRYGSADAFARDLHRWRHHLPVSARRIGPAAKAAKFIRRNPVAVCLAALLALALTSGVGGVAWQAERAQREADHARATRDFLIDLFRQGDPASGGARLDTMTARDLLDAGVRRADGAFARDPQTEMDLLTSMGDIYDWADEPERAEHVWSHLVALASRLYGAADPRVIESTLSLANSEVQFLHDDRAKDLLERIRSVVFTRYGPDSLPRAQWLGARSRSLRATHGGRQEALADAAAAVAIFRAHFPADTHYSDALQDLSGYQYDDEQYEASLTTMAALRALELANHTLDLGEDIIAHSEAASRLERLGRRAEAERDLQWTQDKAEQQFGRQSLWYIHALGMRALMADMQGDRTLAGQLFAQALATGQGRATLSGASTTLRRSYGAALARQGRTAEAIPILEQVLRETQLHSKDEQNLRRTQGLLGNAYDQAGRAAEARVLLLTSRDDFMRYGPADGTGQLGARERWARFLLDHGQGADAAAEFATVIAGTQGRPTVASSLAHAGLARLALARGSRAEAASQSDAAMRLLAQVSAEYDVRASIDVRLIRAQSLAANGGAASARSLAQAALADAQQWDAPGSMQIAHAAAILHAL